MGELVKLRYVGTDVIRYGSQEVGADTVIEVGAGTAAELEKTGWARVAEPAVAPTVQTSAISDASTPAPAKKKSLAKGVLEDAIDSK